MRITLARWRDSRGSSAGCWLIRELPGMMAHYSGVSDNWALVISETLYDIHPADPERVWGPRFSSEKAEALLERNPELKREFKTRSQLISALEAAVARPSQALGQYLG